MATWRTPCANLSTTTRLQIALSLSSLFLVVEISGALLTNSLALLSDASHLSIDVLSFLLALLADHYGKKRQSGLYTYGRRRLDALSAMASVAMLLAVTAVLAYHAVLRVVHFAHNAESGGGSSSSGTEGGDDDGEQPPAQDDIDGRWMSVVAAVGVSVNVLLAIVLDGRHVHLPGSGGSSGSNTPRTAPVVPKARLQLESESAAFVVTGSSQNSAATPAAKPQDPQHPGGCCGGGSIPSLHALRRRRPPKGPSAATAQQQSKPSKSEVAAAKRAGSTSPRSKPRALSEEAMSNGDTRLNIPLLSSENWEDNGLGPPSFSSYSPLPFSPSPPQSPSSYSSSSSSSSSSSTPATPAPLLLDVNLRAAYLHVMGDLIMSISVLIAGLLIFFNPTWDVADPICTLIFSFLVLRSTVGVLKTSANCLLEMCPPEIDLKGLQSSLSSIRGVSNVHDLHVWSLGGGRLAGTVHLTYAELCGECNVDRLGCYDDTFLEIDPEDAFVKARAAAAAKAELEDDPEAVGGVGAGGKIIMKKKYKKEKRRRAPANAAESKRDEIVEVVARMFREEGVQHVVVQNGRSSACAACYGGEDERCMGT